MISPSQDDQALGHHRPWLAIRLPEPTVLQIAHIHWRHDRGRTPATAEGPESTTSISTASAQRAAAYHAQSFGVTPVPFCWTGYLPGPECQAKSRVRSAKPRAQRRNIR